MVKYVHTWVHVQDHYANSVNQPVLIVRAVVGLIQEEVTIMITLIAHRRRVLLSVI